MANPNEKKDGIEQGNEGTEDAKAEEAKKVAEEAAKKAAEKAEPKETRYTEAELRVKLNEARTEERNKLEHKVQQSKVRTSELEDTLEANKAEMKKLKAEEQGLAAKKDKTQKEEVEVESLTKRLEDLQAKNDKQAKQIDSIADTAAVQITQMKIDTYREKQIAKNGIRLTELVYGDSEAEIDERIEVAKAKEKDIFESGRESIREENKGKSPKPLSPEARSSIATAKRNTTERDRIVRLSPKEFAATKQALLAEAEISMKK